MPQEVTDIDRLRDYLKGVLDRADHHAQGVNEVVLAVAGGVVWRKDDGPLEVRTRKGEMGNVLWFTVDGERYALSYNHKKGEIELKAGSTHGKVAASFSNTSCSADVRAVFDGL
ncbi:MAG: hypothetical protein OXH09_10455 [Gammaproteobacteria bacterium]|nr:hypothetical protein [Gammaproteobacteria bacterium]